MKKLFFLLILIAAVACSKKKTEIPADVLGLQEMKSVMTDLLLAQAASGTGAMVDSTFYNTKDYAELILKNHQIKREDFLKSMKFYTDHPELMGEVYDSAIVDLSKIQSQSEFK